MSAKKMIDEKSPFIWIDSALCGRCLSCDTVCPNQVFLHDGNGDEIAIRFIGRCIECGHCVAICPTGAFHHSKLHPERFEAVPKDYPVSPDLLQSLFVRRRSCRCFTGEPITAPELDSLFDAAAAAPTSANSGNVRFIVLDTREDIDALARMTAAYYLKLEKQLNNPAVRFFISLAVGKKTVDAYKFHLPLITERFRKGFKGEQSIFYGAPLVLVAYASGLTHLASANCNLAIMQMMHKAESMGLCTCYNGYALTALLRDKRVRKSLGISFGYIPSAVLAVGRPALTFHRFPKRRRPRAVFVKSNRAGEK